MSIQVLHGDARDVLKTLPANSAQMCCTSPPYYQLRDAGDPRQIGQEPTREAYIKALVITFREVRRILVENGTLFLNLGDTTKDKRRLMIPARVALALEMDGWIIADEIVWHKPRTTPGRQRRRTVPNHEMIYLLAKSPEYYFDAESIKEPALYAGLVRMASHCFRDLGAAGPKNTRPKKADRTITIGETRYKRSVWSVSPPAYADGHFSTMPPEIAETCIKAGSRIGDTVLDPFAGVCTTLLTADRLGRSSIGTELNLHHVEMGRRRIVRDAGMFSSVEVQKVVALQNQADVPKDDWLLFPASD